MKNQRPRFPSHTPVFPSLSFPPSLVFRQVFSPSPWLCRRGQKERQKESMKRKKERREQEKEREKMGKEGGL